MNEMQNPQQRKEDMAVMRKLDTLVADFPDTNTLTEQNEIC